MSQIAVKGGAGGTGTVTIQSPSTSTDRTVTAPDADTILAGLAVTQTYTKPQRGTTTTDNDGSFDLAVTNNFKCTPTGSIVLTFTNMADGQSGFIILDNTGGYTVTKAASTKVASTTLATITTSGVYLLAYYSDGTSTYVVNSGALS